jgi:hypothetical protein
VDIFLDEAGYTGSDLITADQPIFVLASTIIEANEARDLLDFCFHDPQSEVKYVRRVRTPRGQRQILEFLRSLRVDRRRVAFYSVHKEYLLFTHLIEYWLEPIMREDGLNLYERGGNIALANVGYLTLGTCLGRDGRRELLRRFQVMTRHRTRFAFHSFWDSLRQAMNEHELIAQALGPVEIAEHRLGYEHLTGLPPHALDISDLGLLQTVEHWRAELPDEKLVLFHDRSTMLERQREIWEAILDPSNPAAVVGQDRRTIRFPLPVRGLLLEDSRRFPQLQVADLVAGAARTVWNARVNESRDPYCDALLDAGLLNGLAGGMVPTDLVTPDDLETNGPIVGDAAEFIADLLKSHRKA